MWIQEPYFLTIAPEHVRCTVEGGTLMVELTTSLRRIRVLIVDHDPVAIDGLRSILQAHDDLEVVGDAANGDEVIGKLQEMRPNLVLMDGDTLGSDTLEVIARVKRESPDVRILLMAVHADHLGEKLEAGADAFVLKDLGRRELLRSIRKLGGGHAGK